MKVTFKNRVGFLNVYTNEVSFGEYIFKNILEAIEFFEKKDMEEKIILGFFDSSF